MSKMLVCTKAGVHGKTWKVGDKASDVMLKALGGFIPEYFVSEDSVPLVDDAAQAEELRALLRAKGVRFNPNCKLDTLKKKAAAAGIDLDSEEEDPFK